MLVPSPALSLSIFGINAQVNIQPRRNSLEEKFFANGIESLWKGRDGQDDVYPLTGLVVT